MEDFFNKLLTTGQYAKMYGINKRTLMYYDSIGIFPPAIKKENGYRYYTYKQMLLLDSILLLRKLKVPLKDIKNFFKDDSIEKLTNLLYSQDKLLEKQIKELQWLQNIVKNKITNIENNKKINTEKIEIQTLPKQTIVTSEPILAEANDHLIKTLSSFINSSYTNFTYSGFPLGVMIKTKDVFQSQKPTIQFFYLTDNNIQKEKTTSYKAAGKYVIGYHLGSRTTLPKSYEKLFKYIKKNNLKVGEYIFEEQIIDDISTKTNFDYFEFKLSIQITN